MCNWSEEFWLKVWEKTFQKTDLNWPGCLLRYKGMDAEDLRNEICIFILHFCRHIINVWYIYIIPDWPQIQAAILEELLVQVGSHFINLSKDMLWPKRQGKHINPLRLHSINRISSYQFLWFFWYDVNMALGFSLDETVCSIILCARVLVFYTLYI